MNPFSSSAVGVDVSDGTLKAVRLHRRGRRVWLGRTWRLPYFEAPPDSDAPLAALRAFVRSARLTSLPRVVISAPDRNHFSRTYLIPTMEADRVAEMARYEALAELAVPAEDVVVRHHVRKGVVEQQVHTVALQRPRLDDFVQRLAASRIPYDRLETPGFALGSFVEHEDPTGRDRVILGVGQLATHVVLLSEDGIWTRHLPLGLTGASEPAELAARLAAEVDAASSYLLPADRSFRPVDVVLSEEGALSGPLTGALQETLGLPVTRIAELRRIGTTRRFEREQHGAAQVLSMGKAFGLALSGLGLGRYQCPVVEDNPERAARRRLPVAFSSLALSAAGLLVLTQLAERRIERVEQAVPEELVDEMRSNSDRRAGLRREIQELQRRSDVLLALAERRPAAFALREALLAVASVAESRGKQVLHLDSAWLAPRSPGRPGLLTLTVDASPSLDAELGPRLEGALAGSFPAARIRGPQASPLPGVSRWVAEVDLP